MKKSLITAARVSALVALLFLGIARTANATQVSFTTTVYYIGPPTDPTSPPDNTLGPGGTTLTNGAGSNGIADFNGAVTSAGSSETVVFDTGGNPGVTVGSGAGSVFDVQLYGPDPALSSPSSIISGGVLQAGAYVFDSCSSYFGVENNGGQSYAPGCNGVTVPCVTGEVCNAGTSPTDIMTITVGTNGVVTITSGSLAIGFDAPTTPELSTLLLFGTGLLGLAFVLRKRKAFQL